jgi:hypothetical protein
MFTRSIQSTLIRMLLVPAAGTLLLRAGFCAGAAPATQPILFQVQPQPPQTWIQDDQNIVPAPEAPPPVSQHIDGTQSLGECTAPVLAEQLSLLGSVDPDLREHARELLMSLSIDDLPTLRDAVKQVGKLSPTQVGLLREVVCHVSVAPTFEALTGGFLGVLFDRQGNYGLPRLGVGAMVLERIPGFVANRMLCDGDLIDTIEVGSELLPVLSNDDLHERVKDLPPGTIVTLDVLRGGRQISITLVLDARPTTLAAYELHGNSEEFIDVQTAKGQAYWDQNFAPIFRDSTLSSGLTTPLGTASR